MPRSALLNVMVQAVRKAGRALARDFGELEQLQVSRRGTVHFVSATRRRIEDILIESLSNARPGYCFLTPARGEQKNSDQSHRWILSPLSGADNFCHTLPLVATCIALEREGQIVSSVIYNPISNEVFTTEKGKGVFLNDRRLRVATRTRTEDALVLSSLPRHRGTSEEIREDLLDLKLLLDAGIGIRNIGSAALSLAFVAAGRADACFLKAPHICDVSAGQLFLREGGGFLQTLGKGQRVLAANEALKGAISTLFRPSDPRDQQALPHPAATNPV